VGLERLQNIAPPHLAEFPIKVFPLIIGLELFMQVIPPPDGAELFWIMLFIILGFELKLQSIPAPELLFALPLMILLKMDGDEDIQVTPLPASDIVKPFTSAVESSPFLKITPCTKVTSCWVTAATIPLTHDITGRCIKT